MEIMFNNREVIVSWVLKSHGCLSRISLRATFKAFEKDQRIVEAMGTVRLVFRLNTFGPSRQSINSHGYCPILCQMIH